MSNLIVIAYTFMISIRNTLENSFPTNMFTISKKILVVFGGILSFGGPSGGPLFGRWDAGGGGMGILSVVGV